MIAEIWRGGKWRLKSGNGPPHAVLEFNARLPVEDSFCLLGVEGNLIHFSFAKRSLDGFSRESYGSSDGIEDHLVSHFFTTPDIHNLVSTFS